MCMSAPKITTPAAVTPPATQEEKAPDINAVRKKQDTGNSAIAGGTLLTGPSGIENNQLNTGRTSLLGG